MIFCKFVADRPVPFTRQIRRGLTPRQPVACEYALLEIDDALDGKSSLEIYNQAYTHAAVSFHTANLTHDLRDLLCRFKVQDDGSNAYDYLCRNVDVVAAVKALPGDSNSDFYGLSVGAVSGYPGQRVGFTKLTYSMLARININYRFNYGFAPQLVGAAAEREIINLAEAGEIPRFNIEHPEIVWRYRDIYELVFRYWLAEEMPLGTTQDDDFLADAMADSIKSLRQRIGEANIRLGLDWYNMLLLPFKPDVFSRLQQFWRPH
ncbi:MAG: hypothetical protein LBQ83_02650 [Candidatus Margulisbacteria bacterium]|jgi:hypothetical protein|nr:hypothetical protein [Candidatus Margulisiibacteriota bacterium]